MQFFHETLVHAIRHMGTAFAMTPSGGLSAPPVDSGAKRIAFVHANDEAAMGKAVQLINMIEQTDASTLKYRFEAAPIVRRDSVLTPGVLPQELIAFIDGLRRVELPTWIEYEAGGTSKGVFFYLRDDGVYALEVIDGEDAIVFVPYLTRFSIPYQERTILDIVGAYGPYAEEEAAHHGIADPNEVVLMMNSGVDVAILLGSSLGYGDTALTARGLNSQFEVRMGRDPDVDVLRGQEGLWTW